VTDNKSLTGTATSTATIASSGIDSPVANAGGGATSHYDGTVGANVQFNGSASVDPDCNIVTYNWDFGDGSTGLGINPVHSYTVAGDYTVTLTVTDNDNLTGTATATVTIVDSGPLDGAALYNTNCSGCHGTGSNSTKIGATVARINSGISTVSSMNGLATLLSAAEIKAISDYLISLNTTPAPTDGATLYANSCAGCHGATTNSTKIGASVTRINNGITNVASMNSLGTSLTAANIQAISDYLVSLNTTPGPTDGATLYTNNCASCHGAGTNSSKAGATVARINTGISSVTGMNYLSTTLSTANIQAIADFLGQAAPPTTPQGLYTAYCASCHGADGSGGTSGKDVLGESTEGILKAINKEKEMQYLSFISNEQAKLISDFLNGVAPPPTGGGTGETLYANNCAGCHGTGASSAKAGATVARINAGISSVSSMNYFSTTLSAADIQAISDYLISVAPTTPGSGEALYTTNCAGCHGAANNSAKAGATVARINSGISGVGAMNYLSSALTTADIQAIADFLATTTAPPTTPEGLYMTYCSSCHGTDASGGSSDKNVQGDSSSSIQKAIDKEKEMRYLDFLTYDEIRAIAQHLSTLRD
jgi:mono/diheme cytochrome c family protein